MQTAMSVAHRTSTAGHFAHIALIVFSCPCGNGEVTMCSTEQDRAPVARRRLGMWGSAAVVTLAALASGCASTPPPTAQLTAAQQAIDEAERAQAAEHAAAELSQARSKLTAANTAVNGGDMDEALRYAEEARVDAELASARTGAVKAKQANEEIRASTRAMVEELNRNTGGTP
jgi:hypothetical protein